MDFTRREVLRALAGTKAGTRAILLCLLPPAIHAQSVAVTVDTGRVIATSNFIPGCTYNQFCPDLRGHDGAAVAAARALLRKACPLQNAQMIGWGMPDPQPKGGPKNMFANWSSLDARIRFIVQSGGTPIITFCGAPAWMTGTRRVDQARAPEDKQSGDPNDYYPYFATLCAQCASYFNGGGGSIQGT